MSDISRTARQIEEELRTRPGDYLLLRALADMAEEAGETDRVDAMNAAQVAAESVQHLTRLKRETEQLLAMKIDRIDMEIRQVRRKCPHPVKHEEPDASGNNDRTVACLCCGKILR